MAEDSGLPDAQISSHGLQAQIHALDQRDLDARARLFDLESEVPGKVPITAFEKLTRDTQEWRAHFEWNAKLQVE